MKTGRFILITLFLLVFVIIYFNKCRTPQGGKMTGPAQQKQPVLVNSYIVRSSELTTTLQSTGTLLANEEVEIRNEIAGKVVKIAFREGTKVNKGDLLVKLFDSDLQASLRKAEYDKELAEKTEKRQRDLLAINGISQQEYDLSLNAVNRIKADIELLKAQLEKTEIRAPFSGTIGLKTISEGANITVGTRIATMQSTDPMKLEFTVPERFSQNIRVGRKILFTLVSSRDHFEGNVYAYEPKVDPETRSVTVRALCPNKKDELLPGAFAHVEIPMDPVKDAKMVPSQAIIPDLRGQKVFVCKDGKAAPVKVEIGSRNDSTVQILSGLQPGDTLIISGIMQLRPDMPVKVVSSY